MILKEYRKVKIVLYTARNRQRLFLDKWKRFSVQQFVLQVEKWKTKYQENYGVRKRTSATKTPHSNKN